MTLAARLVRAADPGTVVVSETVHQLAAPDAAPVDLGPLKGFAEPVPAYALRPQNGPDSPTDRK